MTKPRALATAAAFVIVAALCTGCPNTDGSSSRTVTPGAHCSPAGAQGKTSAGTLMVCKRASDDTLRWKKAS
jgi:hypothetical protein